jgi:hypothetical protein
VKKVDAKTRGKVGINELLRTIDYRIQLKSGDIPLFLFEVAKIDFFVNYSKVMLSSRVPLCTII